MNAYYFRISIYKRRKLQTIVELPDLATLARFVISSECHRVDNYASGTVKIEKGYCGLPPHTSILLEEWDADCLEELTRKVLECKK